MRGAVVLMQVSGAEVGRFNDLSSEVGFADPRSLLMRKDHGYCVAGRLQGFNKRLNIWRGLHINSDMEFYHCSPQTYLVARRPIVIRHQYMH